LHLDGAQFTLRMQLIFRSCQMGGSVLSQLHPEWNVSQTVTRVAVAGGISDGDHSRPAIELF